MTANPTPAPHAPPPPTTRLVLGPRRQGPSAAVALAVHGIILAGLLLESAGVGERAAGGTGPKDRGGGGSGRPAVNFFTLPASSGPRAIDVPAAPRLTLTTLPPLQQIKLDLPRLEFLPPRENLTPPPVAALGAGAATGGGAGQGTGPGRGQGAGVGTGGGSGVGPGTGGAGGYIFVASPRTAILPPLAKVPGSVAGHTFRIRFWVAADGHVTHVEVEPPMNDAGYSREFLERMMAYQFYPARTRDGQNVASVVTVPLRIGN